ncbi:hypothetical protein BDV10DRAFT_182458 [Aspergillus recurvatus]
MDASKEPSFGANIANTDEDIEMPKPDTIEANDFVTCTIHPEYSDAYMRRPRWKIDLFFLPSYGSATASDKPSSESARYLSRGRQVQLAGDRLVSILSSPRAPRHWAVQTLHTGKSLPVDIVVWGMVVLCVALAKNWAHLERAPLPRSPDNLLRDHGVVHPRHTSTHLERLRKRSEFKWEQVEDPQTYFFMTIVNALPNGANSTFSKPIWEYFWILASQVAAQGLGAVLHDWYRVVPHCWGRYVQVAEFEVWAYSLAVLPLPAPNEQRAMDKTGVVHHAGFDTLPGLMIRTFLPSNVAGQTKLSSQPSFSSPTALATPSARK